MTSPARKLFTLSILWAASLAGPAHAGGRDGGNGPSYPRCSELANLTAQERREVMVGQPIVCVPDNSEAPVPFENGDDYGTRPTR